ncbi:ShlB/FhaC/HecB family hemolysin secretion/activation protein [Leptolyngbya sp. FACHB-671]|uniref:ShlB/FhaC/HecB family hemolysin secretion/activation protein n=1 Tax=Leptolyngbya sp. FACHB-671 TaxID=2692812 RepID=UPI00168A05CB|nr:ShlB/FhaC/HecB family hemolysin secretion/activation protein [Leptolyngbya sp. FACHB-671]MBD2068498.1 ShlB/FhaC/HecB family hemolysin secretion/activation protein [Leptolyngbya sp. FACHB-671]
MPRSGWQWRSHYLSGLAFVVVGTTSIELSEAGHPIRLNFAARAIAQVIPDTSAKAELPKANSFPTQEGKPEFWLPSLNEEELETRVNDAHQPIELAQVPEPPSVEPLPEPEPLPLLPPPEELLETPPAPAPDELPGELPETITVSAFEVVGSTVFDEETLAAATEPFTNRPISFAELLQARSAVTQLYIDAGYVTSGALIPPQTLEDGVVTIQVIEGSLEEIVVTGNRRLNSSYVRERLELAAEPPLNVPRLLEGLQLLQLDPLIQNISAELSAGLRPGTSLLQVEVTEADTFGVQLALDNGRSPTVGSVRRRIQVSEANLLGLGDGLSIGYSNTEGSDGLDANYTLPLNPHNGTLNFSYGTTSSEVIEDPFNFLDIQSESRYYEITYRQPLTLTPTEEFALSLTASRRESESEFLEELIGEPLPFPSLGADEQGRTRVSALRFSQEWTRQESRQVWAARSQFSLGLDALDSTINENAPDSRFFTWRGQGQYVRLLAPDTLLLVRADIQLADEGVVPLEQFGIGGQQTVRGYRQDFLLTDNGALLSAEVRLPIWRVRDIDGLLQVVPFFDIGTGWNSGSEDPDPNTLIGLGAGLQWRQGDRFTARIDFGLPLVSVDSRDVTWQESGIYFSIVYTPF